MNRKTINLEKTNAVVFKDGDINMYFTTAENGIDFRRDSEKFKENISTLKNILGLKNFYYLNQTHSDIVLEATIGNVNSNLGEGDALITQNKNTAIGVFTADCVPVIMYDKTLDLIGAIHSGWKGTFNEISLKTLNKFIEKDSKVEDIKVYIGAHICEKCYEVSEELVGKFKEKDIYENKNISNGRYLSLEKCIKETLKNAGVLSENIKSLELCTYCEKDIKLHSFRKDKDNSGRLLSFVFIK